MNKKIFNRVLIPISLLLSSINIFSQAYPSFEFASSGASTTAQGPTIANQTVAFQVNCNNPNDNVFGTSTVTATYKFSNQQYNSATVSSYPGLVFGVHNTGFTETILPKGVIYEKMNNTTPSLLDIYYTSVSPAGSKGISVTENYGVVLFGNVKYLNAASKPTNGKFYYADLTISFNKPLANPVLQISGMGSYYNNLGASMEFELVNPGTYSLEKLDGNNVFTVSGNNITNSAATIASNYAHGSVKVNTAGNVSEITFKVYIRGDGKYPSWTTHNAGDKVTIGLSSAYITPTITTQPLASQIICQNINPQPLTVVAQGSPDLTYQWYSNTTNSNAGGTAISGANSSTYTPGTATLGIYYYYVVVSNSCGSVTSDVSQMTVQGSSTDFNPTVVAVNEVCATNEGQLIINVPSGGTAPFTYKVTSGTTIPTPVTTMDRKVTFTNLAPGSYTVTVTDVCQNIRTRGPNTLKVGNSAKPDIWNVFSIVNTECNFTDYYLVPGLSDFYPQTYYAYPNGDFTQTPITRTVTSADLVAIPGTTIETGGRKGFLMRLPQASPFVSGNGIAYSFKMTNACYTDVTTVSVKNVKTGDFLTAQNTQNCKNSLSVRIGAGWHQPVNVAVTPEAGGTTRTQTIDGIQSITVFEDVAVGWYNVTLTDKCGNTNTKRVNMLAPNLNYAIKSQCASNVDGLTAFYIEPNTGWQYPISVTILDGPTSYHSPLQNKDITVNYPRVFSPDINDNTILRVRNVVPGTYKLSITDGCVTREVDYTALNTNTERFNIAPLEWTGCTGAQDIVIKNSANCVNLTIMVYQKQSGNNWRLVANGIRGNTLRVNPGIYRVFYTRSYQTNELFKSNSPLVSTPEYTLDQVFPDRIVLTYQDIEVPTISSAPTIGSYVTAECNSTINVRLFGSQNTAKIISYELETYPGSNAYSAPQTSNYFQRTQYGKYQYRVTDACGNSNVSYIVIEKNTAPTLSCVNNADGSKLLTAQKRPVADVQAKYVWTLPDGSEAQGETLLLPANHATGIYKLTVNHTVMDVDDITVACVESNSTEFYIPPHSVVYEPDNNACSGIEFDAVTIDNSYVQSMAWYKDGSFYQNATSTKLKITQSGVYKLVVNIKNLSCPFEYSKQFTIVPCVSVWTGAENTKSNLPENWSDNRVPAPYDHVEFATVQNYGSSAVNDLILEDNMTVTNLTNASDKNLQIPAGKSLTVAGVVTVTNPTTGQPSTDPSKIQVKSATKDNPLVPNGTFIINCAAQSASPNKDVYVTVDLFAKGYKDAVATTWEDNIPGSPTERTTFSAQYHWQHIGLPVEMVRAENIFAGSYVRSYSENKNGSTYYQKWYDLTNDSVMRAFRGYEITQDNQRVFSIPGKLQYCDKVVTLTRSAVAVSGSNNGNVNNDHYGLGQNIFGNSFTASIDIRKLNFDDKIEPIVYLYNSGRFTDWGNAAGINREPTAMTAGQYTSIPQNASPAIYDGRIPSLNGFLLIHRGTKDAGGNYYSSASDNPITLTLPYATGLLQNTRPQTAPKQPLSYLQVSLTSKSTVDNLWLISQPGTTSKTDEGWDGRKMFGTPTAFIFTQNKDGLMQVNADETIDGSVINFYANGDTEYELTLKKSNLEQYEHLHLLDLKTRTFTPLNDEVTVYRFTAANKGVTDKRFKIVNSDNVNPNDDTFKLLDGYLQGNKALVITNYTSDECLMALYDSTGRLLKTEKLTMSVTEIPVILKPGVYILNLQADGKKESVKLIVK